MRNELRALAALALAGFTACAYAVNPLGGDAVKGNPDSAAPSYGGSNSTDAADTDAGVLADAEAADGASAADASTSDVILDVSTVFSSDAGCGEVACTPVVTRDIGSHFSGAACTGVESYYTPYNGYDGVRRSWDGSGLAGTTLRTATNVSFKNTSGVCQDLWPAGNTLSDFVTIYR